MSRKIFVVALVLLVLIVVKTTDTGVIHKYCKPWRWVSTDDGKCGRCPGCKRGQFHDNSTLGPLDEKRGALECHICRQCPDGYYSNQHTRSSDNLRYCRRDRNCTMKNRVYKWKPRRSRKSECGPCLDGYIEERNWDEDDGVCNKIQTTSSRQGDKVTSPTKVKVTSPEDVEVTSLVAVTATNPAENLLPTKRKNHINDLTRYVKLEGKRNRDHVTQTGNTVIFVLSPITILSLLCLLLFLGYKFRMKLSRCCSQEMGSTDRDTSGSPLGSSKTPLMVDGAPSLSGSPEQSVIDVGAPKVSISQTKYCEYVGSSIILSAIVTGTNIQDVVWKRIHGLSTTDHDIAVDNGKYKGSTTTDPSLHISYLCSEDQGVYYCTATNDEGTGKSSLCQLDVKENPDLELTPKEISRARKRQLQPQDDKLIHCIANYARGGECDGHLMEKLYEYLGIRHDRVKQIMEECSSKGARECVFEILSYYVKKEAKKATAYALYKALKDCKYFYELKLYVEKFRDQVCEMEEDKSDVAVTDTETKRSDDENQQGNICSENLQPTGDSCVSDTPEDISVCIQQKTVVDEVKLGIEDVTFTVLDH